MQAAEIYELFLKHPEITTDTRDCPAGSIFFALRGATFNGNDFALKALENGCAYAVVDDPSLTGDKRLIHVSDALAALQQLATLHRRQMRTPIVQITGTNGKTTTKELAAAVLSQKYNVLFTQGNLNNHIGVPKTLLRLRSSHQIAVVETGANHPGEIAALSRIVEADCGLITNVGRAHLEGFGSFEGVVRTKGELYDYLRTKDGSFIFLDGDNPYLCEIARGMQAVRYGQLGKGYEIEGEVTGNSPMLAFKFRKKGGAWNEVRTHLVGAYNLSNALAAISVGCHFGVPPEQCALAIAAYQPSNNRSEWLKTPRNQLIVDAYNANPTSMKAALDNFATVSAAHKMVILGAMRELGEASFDEHKKIAEQAMSLGCEAVWLVGGAFQPFCTQETKWFPDVAAVKETLQGGNCPEGCLILVKGSNGTRLFELPCLL